MLALEPDGLDSKWGKLSPRSFTMRLGLIWYVSIKCFAAVKLPLEIANVRGVNPYLLRD